MAKKVIIRDEEGNEYPYTMIESLDDIGKVPCIAPTSDLIECFNEGNTIIVNRMGGYCFFVEKYHTIVSEEGT